MKKFTTIDGKNEITRVSRWITIRHNYNVNKNNSLYDFSTDEDGIHPYQDDYNPENGTYLDYFYFKGQPYALDQFYILGSPWIGGEPYRFKDTDGTVTSVGAVDMDGNIFAPLYLEIDDHGERVRLYEVKHLKS